VCGFIASFTLSAFASPSGLPVSLAPIPYEIGASVSLLHQPQKSRRLELSRRTLATLAASFAADCSIAAFVLITSAVRGVAACSCSSAAVVSYADLSCTNNSQRAILNAPPEIKQKKTYKEGLRPRWTEEELLVDMVVCGYSIQVSWLVPTT
jgi:hypothetical protein